MAGAIPGLTDIGSVSPLPAVPGGDKNYPSLTPSQAAKNAKDAGASNVITSTNGGDNQTLGKTAFLQLLVQEMTNQDPLQPADNTQFIAQLAQFSSLEQMQNMNTTLGSLVTGSQLSQANNLLGHDVTAVDASSGTPISGWVDKVLVTSTTDSSGNPTQQVEVDINGNTVSIGDIQSVGGIDPQAFSSVGSGSSSSGTGTTPSSGSSGTTSSTGSGSGQ